ncbi:MAG: hypothetical protein ACRBBV_09920 [Paracoccaceae bacterium]
MSSGGLADLRALMALPWGAGVPALEGAEGHGRVWLDGALFGADGPATDWAGGRAVLFRLDADALAALLPRISAASVLLYQCAMPDWAELAAVQGMQRLGIERPQAAVDLLDIGQSGALQWLGLRDLRHQSAPLDLGGLLGLSALGALALGGVAGRMSGRMQIASLAPLADLPALETLHLDAVEVPEEAGGGLTPLSGCAALRNLHLPNSFPTGEYAMLSNALTQVTCARFAPWLACAIRGAGGRLVADISITGQHKPALLAREDAARIARYERQWADMTGQDGWGAAPGPMTAKTPDHPPAPKIPTETPINIAGKADASDSDSERTIIAPLPSSLTGRDDGAGG